MLNFMRLRWVYFLISAIVIIPGLFSLLRFGLRPSIDFTGGTQLEVQIVPKSGQKVEFASLQTLLKGNVVLQGIEPKANQTYVLRVDEMNNDQRLKVLDVLSKTYDSVTQLHYETVGPVLGKELLVKTLTAMLLSAAGITLYVAYRFHDWRYGVCAVLAMFHDSLVLFGVFSLLGHFLNVEVDVLFVTAVLTILSFSVHDTIVVYDRIRELRKKQRGMAYWDTINLAVTETMSRSINNSMTIIMMLLALWLLGGDSIHWFVFALLIGTITGTYSSTFTAAPLLTIWQDLQDKRIKVRRT